MGHELNRVERSKRRLSQLRNAIRQSEKELIRMMHSTCVDISNKNILYIESTFRDINSTISKYQSMGYEVVKVIKRNKWAYVPFVYVYVIKFKIAVTLNIDIGPVSDRKLVAKPKINFVVGPVTQFRRVT